MYTRGVEFPRIKRFGRWQSDAFHGYLWESHEPMKSVAQKMASDSSSLTNPARGALRGAAGAQAPVRAPSGGGVGSAAGSENGGSLDATSSKAESGS